MAKRRKKSAHRRRRRSTSTPQRSRSKSKSGLPSWMKIGLKVAAGVLVGGLAQPLLPAAVSGPAVGVAVLGVATSGFHLGALPLAGIGVGIQAAHSLGTTKTFSKAQALLTAGAAAAGAKVRSGPHNVSLSLPSADRIGKAIETAASYGETATKVAAMFA